MHTLIVGARQVGKSTLIARVLREIGRPVFGFETKKEDALEDAQLGSPIYIYPAGEAHEQRADNLVGYCKDRRPLTNVEVFDRWAQRIACPPQGCMVLLDELGFMESSSEAFCSAVMALLDGDVPVIAAVKHNRTPFLDAVRSHKNCRCFHITPDNREECFAQALAFMRAQLEEEKA